LINPVVLPATPPFIKALARAANSLANPPTFLTDTTITSILAVNSPGIDLFKVARRPTGCVSLASAGTATSFNLGQGSFVPIQLIVSQDQARAYVTTSNHGDILAFNIDNQTSFAIPLVGDAVPIQASLTPDGSRLYVAANDGQVHILDTQSGGDIQQISFPTDAATFQAGLCHGVTFTCNPDLIAVKP
jgi:DNA-binding beta-propeller fold protein YncE